MVNTSNSPKQSLFQTTPWVSAYGFTLWILVIGRFMHNGIQGEHPKSYESCQTGTNNWRTCGAPNRREGDLFPTGRLLNICWDRWFTPFQWPLWNLQTLKLHLHHTDQKVPFVWALKHSACSRNSSLSYHCFHLQVSHAGHCTKWIWGDPIPIIFSAQAFSSFTTTWSFPNYR